MTKNLLCIVVILAITFLPIFPAGRIEPPDPVSVTDDRVAASISENDLKKILKLVRNPRWGGFWEVALRLGEGMPILSVTDARGGKELVREKGEFSVRNLEAMGKVEVKVGKIKRPLQGSGYQFIFDKIDGEWELLRRSWWLS